MGAGCAHLWDGRRLPSFLCWPAHTDLWKDSLRQGEHLAHILYVALTVILSLGLFYVFVYSVTFVWSILPFSTNLKECPPVKLKESIFLFILGLRDYCRRHFIIGPVFSGNAAAVTCITNGWNVLIWANSTLAMYILENSGFVTERLGWHSNIIGRIPIEKYNFFSWRFAWSRVVFKEKSHKSWKLLSSFIPQTQINQLIGSMWKISFNTVGYTLFGQTTPW